MKVYVVTGVELGWDCVVGVFTNEEIARKEYPDGDYYVIHEETLNRTTIEDYEEDIEEEFNESLEQIKESFENREARAKFNEVISSRTNKVCVSKSSALYNVDLLIDLLDSNGFKITYTGKTGYTMEKCND